MLQPRYSRPASYTPNWGSLHNIKKYENIFLTNHLYTVVYTTRWQMFEIFTQSQNLLQITSIFRMHVKIPKKQCNHQNLDKTLTRWLNGSLCVDGSNLRSQFRLHSLARDASDFLARSLNTRDYQKTPSEKDFQNSVRNQTPNTNHLFSFLHKSNTFPYIFNH